MFTFELNVCLFETIFALNVSVTHDFFNCIIKINVQNNIKTFSLSAHQIHLSVLDSLGLFLI